jgi:hypothetical protein
MGSHTEKPPTQQDTPLDMTTQIQPRNFIAKHANADLDAIANNFHPQLLTSIPICNPSQKYI